MDHTDRYTVSMLRARGCSPTTTGRQTNRKGSRHLSRQQIISSSRHREYIERRERKSKSMRKCGDQDPDGKYMDDREDTGVEDFDPSVPSSPPPCHETTLRPFSASSPFPSCFPTLIPFPRFLVRIDVSLPFFPLSAG